MQTWVLRGVCVLVGIAFSLSLHDTGVIALAPFAAAAIVVMAESLLRPVQVRAWTSVLIGAGVGIGLTALTSTVIRQLLPSEAPFLQYVTASLSAFFVTAGMLAFYHKRDVPLFASPTTEIRRRDGAARILDTSVIIDGRIANICRTGFLQGTLLLPRFVLKELQYIADSADTLRRNKGRRGMDVLTELQANPDLIVDIVEEDLPDIEEVDAKLVALAKMINGRLLSNDYNLKSIAEIEGVQVLNVNELANAVKPEIIQGESMTVRIIREGKEPNQGVAYLEDGTMVVVDNGKECMHQTLSVEVTSVLQTSAGRMIVARIRDDRARHEKAL